MRKRSRNINFTTKIVLSLLLIVGLVVPYSGWGIGKVEAATEYYYDKYEEVKPNFQSYTNTRLGSNSSYCQYVHGDGCVHRATYYYEGYSSFSGYDPLTKTYKLSGYITNPQVGQTLYRMLGDRLSKEVVKATSRDFDSSPGYSESGTWYSGDRELLNAGESTFIATYKRLVQSNIKALDGSYPENVKHTDGYWYVKKGPTNIAPTINFSTLSGQIVSDVLGFNQLTLSGTVQDLNAGDILSVKYSIDGTTHTAKIISTLTANASNQGYSIILPIDSSIPEGTRTLRVWVEDNKGGKSAERTITLNIDKTAPLISFSNINEGETKFGEFTPQITVTDVNAPTHTMKLNGNAYNGIPITNSGDYTLEVTATDSVGNTSNKSVSFTINQKPYSIKTIDKQTLNKFDEVTFLIDDYFKDVENDLLTADITNSDSSVVSAIVDNNELVVKALKQGAATVTIKVNDGHSDSDTLTINVDVETRSPVITINNDSWILADDSTDIELSGTVLDADQEKITITGMLNNVSKSYVISESTGNDDNWSLTWTDTDLPNGVYPSIDVKAEDDFNGKHETTFNHPIVKVTGDKLDYMLIVDGYELDKGNEPNNWTIEEHTALLEAYETMNQLVKINNVANQIEAKNKVEALTNGQVKNAYLEEIQKLALEWLMVNLDKATVTDYERAGFTDVQANRLPDYEQAFNEYESSKSPLTPEDMQQVIDTINAVIDARENPSTNNIQKAYDAVNGLEDGTLKDRLLQELEDISVEYVSNHPDTIKVSDLAHANIENVNPDRLKEYQNYLQDTKTYISPITKNDIQNVIDSVNAVLDAYLTVVQNPNRPNLDDFVAIVSNLNQGTFKTEQEKLIPEVTLMHVNYLPNHQDDITYTWLGQVYDTNNVDAYNEYLPYYAFDLSPVKVSHAELNTFINAVDSFEFAYETPIAVNVSKAIDDIKEMKNGSAKEILLINLSEKVLSSINDDLGNATIEDLANVGIKDLDKANEKEYQDALKAYQDELGRDLTLEDIQNIVDAINKIKDTEASPTAGSLQDALDAISKLVDGPLKDSLLERLKDAAVEFITQNPDNVTVTILEMAGIDNIDPSLIDEYNSYLPDYQPLTYEKIQQVINVTNQLHKALLDLTASDVTRFTDTVEQLEPSILQTKLTTVSDALASLIAHETNPSDDSLLTLESTLKDVQTQDKAYIESMATSLEFSITTALAPTDEDVLAAVQLIGQLREGKFKTRLLIKTGDAFLEYVQKNPDKVTSKDLIKAGFERVNKENIKEYREGLIASTEVVGKLDRENIQLIIDVVNGLKDNTITLDMANELKSEINKLIDSDWKVQMLHEVDKLIYKLTPKRNDDSPKGDINSSGNTNTESPKNTVFVKGEESKEGINFSISPGTIDGTNNQWIVAKGQDVEIIIPAGSIDFSTLLKELGKFGLLIQLIKIDEANYKLSVKAITPQGEKELANFEKHLSVAMQSSNVMSLASIAFVGPTLPKQPVNNQSVVLRKEGDTLTAVPHTFNGKDFTIKTTRAGNFVVVNNPQTKFGDIANNGSSAEIIDLANRRIVNGTTPTTYSPNTVVTKAQLAAMIARAMDLHSTAPSIYKDVQGKWYEGEIQALQEAGIILGTSQTTFSPESPVTRQEAAQMMANALRYGGAQVPKNLAPLLYSDLTKVNETAKIDIALLHELNIMTGKGDNRFDPNSSLTRAQMAKILNRTLKEIGFM